MLILPLIATLRLGLSSNPFASPLSIDQACHASVDSFNGVAIWPTGTSKEVQAAAARIPLALDVGHECEACVARLRAEMKGGEGNHDATPCYEANRVDWVAFIRDLQLLATSKDRGRSELLRAVRGRLKDTGPSWQKVDAVTLIGWKHLELDRKSDDAKIDWVEAHWVLPPEPGWNTLEAEAAALMVQEMECRLKWSRPMTRFIRSKSAAIRFRALEAVPRLPRPATVPEGAGSAAVWLAVDDDPRVRGRALAFLRDLRWEGHDWLRAAHKLLGDSSIASDRRDAVREALATRKSRPVVCDVSGCKQASR